ncbi:MAG TPA: hypothetical protein VHS28_00700 [Chloroflexota bacterium]|nr:hypothetical protein [Chloroflexota bacterium]
MPTTVMDGVVLFLLLLPAIVLLVMLAYSSMPWISKSWREAEERAEVLVQSLMTEEEYAKIKREGYLDVPSPAHPQRIYRIPSGVGTVTVLEDGRCVARLCVYSTQPIPEREAILVHKLMIEGNEQDYLKAANHLPC